jgi:hypothetical protein
MSKIEDVAKAINAKQQMNVYGEIKVEWEALPIMSKTITLGLAKAAIEAMRDAWRYAPNGTVYYEDWERVIDAILKE